MVVAQRDDSPPDMINGKLKITVTEYTKQKRRPINFDRSRMTSLRRFREWRRPIWHREIANILKPVFHSIPADGVVVFPIKTNSSVTKLVVKVTI